MTLRSRLLPASPPNAAPVPALRAMMEQILQPIMFDIPDRTDVVSIVIGEDTVLNGTEPRYVLQAPDPETETTRTVKGRRRLPP